MYIVTANCLSGTQSIKSLGLVAERENDHEVGKGGIHDKERRDKFERQRERRKKEINKEEKKE